MVQPKTNIKMSREEKTIVLDATQRERSGGFALLSLVSLAPLLLSLLMTLGALSHFLTRHTEYSNQCVNVLMVLQDQLAEKLKQLMLKNKPALTLRKRERQAKTELLAAIATANAVKILNAEQKLIKIQLKQVKLSIEQKNILAESLALSAKAKINLKSKMHGQKIKPLLPTGLAVEPDIFNDIAPAYILKKDFSNEQMSSAQYEFVSAQFENLRRTYKFSCAATIEKRANQYRATLVTDAY
jgi:hypothetical protein